MDRKPAEVRHPGEHLKDELEARNWSAREFSKMGAFDIEYLFKLITGEASINNLTAQMISIVLGTSPEYWTNLQRAWDEFQERNKEKQHYARTEYGELFNPYDLNHVAHPERFK